MNPKESLTPENLGMQFFPKDPPVPPFVGIMVVEGMDVMPPNTKVLRDGEFILIDEGFSVPRRFYRSTPLGIREYPVGEATEAEKNARITGRRKKPSKAERKKANAKGKKR